MRKEDHIAVVRYSLDDETELNVSDRFGVVSFRSVRCVVFVVKTFNGIPTLRRAPW